MHFEFLHVLEHSIEDTLPIIPFLFLIYLIIEILERKYNSLIAEKSPKLGVIGGALFGLIPQCGFSVMASVLYSKKRIFLPTLMAIFLATSDEALPIVLASGNYMAMVNILTAKLVIAVVAGYIIYLFTFKKQDKLKAQSAEVDIADVVNEADDADGCCGHVLHAHSGEHTETRAKSAKHKVWDYIKHPLRHTLWITLWIFVVTFIIIGVFEVVGDEAIRGILTKNIYLEPIFSSLFGLIPNCAASVGITKLYLEGALTFGGAMAGLSAGAGVGVVVLFQKNRPTSENVKIILLLFLISVASGVLINLGMTLL